MTHDHDDNGLNALFARARDQGPRRDLMARVLSDAAAVQASVPPDAAPVREGWWRRITGALGGWSAVSGITAAGVTGLAVGLYAPDTVAGLLQSDALSLGYQTYEFTPDMGDLWTEDGDV